MLHTRPRKPLAVAAWKPNAATPIARVLIPMTHPHYDIEHSDDTDSARQAGSTPEVGQALG